MISVASLFQSPLRVLALMGGLLALSSCTNAPPPEPTFPPITFTQSAPIKLLVGRVEVVHEYVPPLTKPNVEHQFPIPPAAMAQRWAQDRLVAAGGQYVARFVVKRASAIETQLPRTEGVRAVFTTDQDKKYDVSLAVELQIVDGRNLPVGIVNASVERSTTTPEGITLADREKVWYQLVKDMGAALNDQLEQGIRNSIGSYVTY